MEWQFLKSFNAVHLTELTAQEDFFAFACLGSFKS
jgi:hypothetical protein